MPIQAAPSLCDAFPLGGPRPLCVCALGIKFEYELACVCARASRLLLNAMSDLCRGSFCCLTGLINYTGQLRRSVRAPLTNRKGLLLKGLDLIRTRGRKFETPEERNCWLLPLSAPQFLCGEFLPVPVEMFVIHHGRVSPTMFVCLLTPPFLLSPFC